MFEELENKIGYTFKDKEFLKLAFTHSSYAYERKMKVYESNERLEFLGDAVLETVISHYLYTTYNEIAEGELSKMRALLVCESTLADNARKLNLGGVLLFGRGEMQTGGAERDSTLSDAMEALIGAVYLDGGLECARTLIMKTCTVDVDSLKGTINDFDYKTSLQEHFQKIGKEPLKYKLIKEEGPDHDKTFTVALNYKGKVIGEGTGKNKKEAEQKAAYEAYKNVVERNENKRG